MKKITILSFLFLCCANNVCMEQPSDASHVIQLFAAIENKKNEDVKQIITEFPQTTTMYHKYNNDSRVLFGEVTPLHVAVYRDDKPSVALLLAAGADCNAQTQGSSRKDAPLHLAKSADIVQRLVQKKASVHTKNRFGWTPLYAALFHPHCCHNLEVAQSLVAAGADVNERLKDNNDTLLHEAMTVFRQGIVLFLLVNGADRTLLNDKGKTALQAIQARHTFSRELIDAIIECLDSIPERK
jgi:ankyrin repeat protein